MNPQYPLWIEKVIFLVLIGLSVYGGMLLQDYLSGVLLWISWLCIMPIAVLVITEGIGRTVQSVYLK
ncbi:MAG: hypothetical protein L7S49_02990 [Candidatus Poseidoniaceae archaeon]|nr:hypothetical protein [Candidatus Poseidoniaceae archaeon]